MSKLKREIISRCALAVLALSFLTGGYKCLATGVRLTGDARKRQQSDQRLYRRRDGSGSGIFYLAGGVLVILGSAFTLAAVLPTRAFERLIGPPRIRTHEQPDYDHLRHLWW